MDHYKDHFVEYQYEAVFEAAWKLADTVPVADSWAKVLGWMMHQHLRPVHFSAQQAVSMALRWKTNSHDAKSIEIEIANNSRGMLSDLQRVRKGLARLALRNNIPAKDLISSEDLAFRCAVYSNSWLTPNQMKAAYEGDGEIAYNEMLANSLIWQKDATRRALRGIASKVVVSDRYADLMAINMYEGSDKHHRTQNPEWFTDEMSQEDPTPPMAPPTDPGSSTSAPLTEMVDEIHINMSTALELLKQSEQRIRREMQRLEGLEKRMGWIIAFGAGSLIFSALAFLGGR